MEPCMSLLSSTLTSESIAHENSSAYFPLLTAIASYADSSQGLLPDDESLYKMLINHSLEMGFLSESQRAYVDTSLAMHRYSALIQAHFQYYDSWLSSDYRLDCDNVLVYNNEQTSCDIGTVFALKTAKKKTSEPSLFPFDRILGSNNDAPLVILYGDLTSEQFSTFHVHLSSSALDGKIRYVLRYKPRSSSSSLYSSDTANEPLSGYGVALNVKRTDYIVIDDRHPAAVPEQDDEVEKVLAESVEEKKGSQGGYKKLQETSESAVIDKAALPLLGFRTAGHIMNSEDPFDSLLDVCLNFPKYSKAISESAQGLEVSRDVRHNVDNDLLNPGQNLMLVNGAPAFSTEENVFELLETIDTERRLVHKLADLGFRNVTSARMFIEDNVLDSVHSFTTRFDYRGLSNSSEGDEEGDEPVSPLVWINDIALDEPYMRMSPDLSIYNKPLPALGGIHPVRHNTHSMVFALDMADGQALQNLAQALTFVMRGVPVQLGVIPLGWTPKGTTMAKHIYALSTFAHRSEVLARYLALCMMGQDPEAAFDQLAGSKSDTALKSPYVKDMLAKSKDWAKTFDLSSNVVKDHSVCFVNGLVVDQNPATFMRETAQILKNDVDLIREYMKSEDFDASSVCLRDWLIRDGLKTRNSLVMPSDMSSVQYIDTSDLWVHFADLESLPLLTATANEDGENNYYYSSWLFADMGQKESIAQVAELLQFVESQNGRHNVRINIVPIRGPRGNAAKRQKAEIVMMNLNRMSFAEKKLALGELSDSEAATVGAHELYERLGLDFNLDSSKLISAVSEVLLSTSHPGLLRKNNIIVVSGRVSAIGDAFLDSSDLFTLFNFERPRVEAILATSLIPVDSYKAADSLVSLYTTSFYRPTDRPLMSQAPGRVVVNWKGTHSNFTIGDSSVSDIHITAVIDPVSERGQEYVALLESLIKLPVSVTVFLNPKRLKTDAFPLKRFYRGNFPVKPDFGKTNSQQVVRFDSMPQSTLFTAALNTPSSWIVMPSESIYDLDNIVLESVDGTELEATYQLEHILVEGHANDLTTTSVPRGVALDLCKGADSNPVTDTLVMANLGYLQLKANPGLWTLRTKPGRSSKVFSLVGSDQVWVTKMTGVTLYPQFKRNKGMENVDVLDDTLSSSSSSAFGGLFNKLKGGSSSTANEAKNADINIFSVASGHLYERFLSIMTSSVMKHTNHTVKFWFIENFLSPSFKQFLPELAAHNGFDYELVTYKWPHWLRGQPEKQREIWGYKILFLDVLFPLSLDKVIFVDADQIVRTDLKELVDEDLDGAPYGYTPMCDSREEMEGFRFWKQGYWEKYLDGLPYHISALYVVDLNRFRQMAAGDILRQHYQQLSADPGSLSNLDQDLPNHLQNIIPIHSLSQDWLWCETWCSDEALKTAKTIDLCNNPLTKEPKLDRARRQLPEWTGYDNEIAELRRQFDSRRNAETKDDVEGRIPKSKNDEDYVNDEHEDHDHHEDL